MTKLTFQEYVMPAADLGEENLLPDIKNIEYIHAGYTLTERVAEEDRTHIGKGMIRTMLPYSIQDNYNRDRKMRSFQAAVLENDYLKATFLPEVGGRLWSLYHKKLQKELLYVNPVFQPGNLALRNAWFSGGIEWNIGIKGHNPLTCSPMFCCRMEDEKGVPCLRMYEFERIRGIVYSIDFLLPEGSDILYVRTTVENTDSSDKFMYWWSNIAVPEYPGTRVLVPTEESFLCFYNENAYVLDTVELPTDKGKDAFDRTYPKNAKRSQDYFFRLPKESRKWVTALNEDGCGLLQFSTKELIGRKMFLWGQGQGGKNWSNWLSGRPYPYIEIQAGLARTQLEHIPMKADTCISWVEGYCAASFAPETVHGEYRNAVAAVEKHLDQIMPSEEDMRGLFLGQKPVSMDHHGSGWGYVENRLREITGKKPLSSRLDFPAESVTPAEQIWLDFLADGYMKEEPLDTPPLSYQADKAWLKLFEEQIRSGKANAYMYLQYGVTLYANERVDEAYEAFLMSAQLSPGAWAYRNLSIIEKNEYKNIEKALKYMKTAISFNKENRNLMVNCAQVMLQAEAYKDWLDTFEALSPTLQSDGRLLLYKAMAYMKLDRYEEAAGIINADFCLSDIKEGEVSVSHIWEDLYKELLRRRTHITDESRIEELYLQEHPLPAHLDFRMDR